MPLIALALPCVALPFAQVLYSNTTADNIITFHRMLFAVPFGLAVVTALTQIMNLAADQPSLNTPFPNAKIPHALLPRSYAFLIIPMALGAVMTIPIGAPNYNDPPYYNRMWNSLVTFPADLRCESSEGQTSPSSHAAFLSRHWSPQRSAPIKVKIP